MRLSAINNSVSLRSELIVISGFHFSEEYWTYKKITVIYIIFSFFHTILLYGSDIQNEVKIQKRAQIEIYVCW
jgi:hypothetical protein